MERIELDHNGLQCVENFPGVLSYICDSIKRSMLLTKFMRVELTELFGKHNRVYSGEFYYYIWDFSFGNDKFSIATAKDKGTQFSIMSELEEAKGEECIEFLKHIEKLLLYKNKIK